MSFLEGGFPDTTHTTILPSPLDQVYIYIAVYIHITPLPACHLQEEVSWFDSVPSLQHPRKNQAGSDTLSIQQMNQLDQSLGGRGVGGEGGFLFHLVASCNS